MCNQLECDTKYPHLRCHLPDGHKGPGNAWAVYPPELKTFDMRSACPKEEATKDVPQASLELVSAAARLVDDLVKGWNAEKAVVLADWCEEREFMGAAEDLRKGPSMRTRAFIEFLAFMFGLVEPPKRQHWELNWLPDSKQEPCIMTNCRSPRSMISFRRFDTKGAYCDACYSYGLAHVNDKQNAKFAQERDSKGKDG